MTIHYLSDFPYEYTTKDESDSSDNVVVSDESGNSDNAVFWGELAGDWHNDPNHNVEPKSVKQEIPVTLDEYNKAGKTRTMVESLTNTYESDKRVERLFLTQQGEVWLVWHIIDIPENADNEDYSHIVRDGWGFTAKDGSVTMMTATLFFTHDRAMEHIRETVSMLAKYAESAGETFYSHVYELNKM
jgi:hypothetical protein